MEASGERQSDTGDVSHRDEHDGTKDTMKTMLAADATGHHGPDGRLPAEG
jgi:hypothetical protein